jgi:2-dehydropantoate 2-reductase
MEILIAGIGGIGGYYGGKLAYFYHNHPEIHISFFARGENLDAIRTHGLKLQTTTENFLAKPYRISDNIKDLPLPDFILLAVKSYDLESAVMQLKDAVTKDAIIIPLLNGLEPIERLMQLFPDNVVCYGCVYSISVLKAPRHIVRSGTVDQIYFGLPGRTNDRLLQFGTALRNAGVNAICTENVLEEVWKKFSFLSPIAAVTTYTNSTLGVIRENDEKKNLLRSLMEEALMVAKAKGISLPPDIIEKNLALIAAQPYEGTSSMHRDVQMGRQTEIETLLGYVIKEAKGYGLQVPFYEKIYTGLKKS